MPSSVIVRTEVADIQPDWTEASAWRNGGNDGNGGNGRNVSNGSNGGRFPATVLTEARV